MSRVIHSDDEKHRPWDSTGSKAHKTTVKHQSVRLALQWAFKEHVVNLSVWWVRMSCQNLKKSKSLILLHTANMLVSPFLWIIIIKVINHKFTQSVTQLSLFKSRSGWLSRCRWTSLGVFGSNKNIVRHNSQDCLNKSDVSTIFPSDNESWVH